MRIFISYRRADSRSFTERIYDYLVDEFGRERIFQDVDNIPAGEDFRAVLRQAVSECDVVLVVIGRQWLTISDEHGRRRLDSPNDFVRIEIESAFALQKPILPVLVDGAAPPPEDDLPSSLRELAFRNAAPVRYNPDFSRDMERLVVRLKQLQAQIEAQAAEAARLAEEARKAEETRRREAARVAEQERQAEVARQREEARRAEQARATEAAREREAEQARRQEQQAQAEQARPQDGAALAEVEGAPQPVPRLRIEPIPLPALLPASAAARIAIVLAALALTTCALLPLAWLLVFSFSPPIGQSGWGEALISLGGTSGFGVSMTYALAAGSIASALGALTSYGWTHTRNARTRRMLLIVMTLPRFVPAILLALPLLLWTRDLGAFETPYPRLGLYVALALPFAVWIMNDYFARLTPQAGPDTEVRISPRELLRLLRTQAGRGAQAAAFAAGALVAWQDYALHLVFDRRAEVLIVQAVQTRSAFGADSLAPAAAMAILILLPALPLAWVVLSHLRSTQSPNKSVVVE